MVGSSVVGSVVVGSSVGDSLVVGSSVGDSSLGVVTDSPMVGLAWSFDGVAIGS